MKIYSTKFYPSTGNIQYQVLSQHWEYIVTNVVPALEIHSTKRGPSTGNIQYQVLSHHWEYTVRVLHFLHHPSSTNWSINKWDQHHIPRKQQLCWPSQWSCNWIPFTRVGQLFTLTWAPIPNLPWFLGNVLGSKGSGVLMTTSPTECLSVYKNLVLVSYTQYAFNCGNMCFTSFMIKKITDSCHSF